MSPLSTPVPTLQPRRAFTRKDQWYISWLPFIIVLLFTGCSSISTAQVTENTDSLQISEDGRWFIQSDGDPFFYLGDTAWELFHRLDLEEAELYLKDRSMKGFTVIQAVVLAELDGLHTPNPYGHTPLINDNPAEPDEDYFEHVDDIVNKANELGMYIGMLPTWGDKFNQRWGTGPEVFTPESAYLFGQFLGDRYRGNQIIWILGGDRNPEEEHHFDIIRNMADGIRSTVGDAQLITYHPQGASKSYQWFHEDDWLDFNMFQSSHGSLDMPNYQFTLEGYNLTPVKPIIDAEPRYEDHPVNWNPDEGWFSDFDVRQAAWWSMLSGAAGHTYGDHNIWQMWEPGHSPVSSARTPWYEAINHIGSTQMGYMRHFFESLPYQELNPDMTWIVNDNERDARHIRASSTSGLQYRIAYIPYGQSLTVNISESDYSAVQATWYNPRNSEKISIGLVDLSDQHTFNPPGETRRGNDWVLLLEGINP